MLKQMQVRLKGMVQGVGFRYYVEQKAFPLGLTGYVRNLNDGRVEVIAEGSELVLKRFLELVKQGPSFSHVAEAEVEWRDASGKYHTFEIKL